MRHALAAGILLVAICVFPSSSHGQQQRPPAPPAGQSPATQPAGAAGEGAATDVPVKQVVLFSSGVGYFEHFGTVRGDGTTELRFKTDQINDVLKSLVLQDLDKGQVGTVSYPSQEPIAKTLKSFQVDITSNPPLADLLNQLRGARITATLAEGNVKGTIVGVERRQDQVGDKPQIIEYWLVNLKVGSHFRAINLSQIRDFSLDDPKLEAELDKALAALAQARDQEKKPVTIHFKGQGERRVRVGYVVETPIWKTSYRLVLAGADEKPAGGGKGDGAGAGGAARGAADAKAAGPSTKPVESRPATPDELKGLREDASILRAWADNMDGQYGSIHPATIEVRNRQKEVDAAVAAGRMPRMSPPPLAPPADELKRKNMDNEVEVLTPWVEGYERGYGKDHPVVAYLRERLTQVEAALDAPATKPAPGAPGAKPQTRPAAGAPARADRKAKLQGWAIVENQTDNDWNDVQLSLVSGRPLSFIQDLYHPIYIPRPLVFPNVYASLRPQTYAGGISEQDEQKLREQQAQNGLVANNAPNFDLANRRSGRNTGFGNNALFGNQAPSTQPAAAQDQPMDPTASVVSAASAAQLGELFEYTVGSVSLARQKSAMIPIVTDDIDVEKVSIYNQNVLANHPLNGAKVRNTTSKHLLQGPVTVLEAGSYAGDARIDDVPPGQSRLLSYGIDLNLFVDPNAEPELTAARTVQSAKIAKGLLQVTVKNQAVQSYALQNKGDAPRTVIVEHPRDPDGRLVEPAAPEEVTPNLYRIRVRVDARKTAKLNVKTEGVASETVQILPTNDETLVSYAQDAQVPEAVRTALGKAVQMKSALADTQRQIEERKKQIAEVTTEQTRIRENMKTVDSKTEYYNRLLKKLDEQETGIEKLQKENADLQKNAEQQRKDLEAYVAGLNVG